MQIYVLSLHFTFFTEHLLHYIYLPQRLCRVESWKYKTVQSLLVIAFVDVFISLEMNEANLNSNVKSDH